VSTNQVSTNEGEQESTNERELDEHDTDGAGHRGPRLRRQPPGAGVADGRRDVLEPALQGTRNVLASVERSTLENNPYHYAKTVPDIAVRILGPRFGLTQQYIRNHLGIRFAVDNRRSTDELGPVYRPVSRTVLDHFESWLHGRGARGRR
jgi:hypothetical protein